jgi:threonine dehydratase
MATWPTVEHIERAARVIAPVFLNSPQFELDVLNEALGLRLVCKIETLNPIRSFKGRGADYFVQCLGSVDTRLVCASAGNFGQGLAYACRKRGLTLTVYAAASANPLKLDRMRQLGAEVRLAGADFDAAKAAARAEAEAQGFWFVEDGRDTAITEGAGTIGLELCRYDADFDALLVPLGNGALINGIGTWYKARRPQTQIIGVVAAGAPAMAESWRLDTLVCTEQVDTIADGIAVRVPVPEALDVMKSTVDAVLRVDDEALCQAMQLAHRLVGVVVEPAGVAGLAAAMVYRERFAGQVLATPFCGSCLTEAQMRQWL